MLRTHEGNRSFPKKNDLTDLTNFPEQIKYQRFVFYLICKPYWSQLIIDLSDSFKPDIRNFKVFFYNIIKSTLLFIIHWFRLKSYKHIRTWLTFVLFNQDILNILIPRYPVHSLCVFYLSFCPQAFIPDNRYFKVFHIRPSPSLFILFFERKIVHY